MGHYCRACGRVRANERFSGKGHRNYVCKDCSRLPRTRAAGGLEGRKQAPPRFKVEPHSFGFKPGIDLDRIEELVDELEAEEVARKLRR